MSINEIFRIIICVAVGTVFWVKCTECGAETQSEITKQRAAEKWNRRGRWLSLPIEAAQPLITPRSAD